MFIIIIIIIIIITLGTRVSRIFMHGILVYSHTIVHMYLYLDTYHTIDPHTNTPSSLPTTLSTIRLPLIRL